MKEIKKLHIKVYKATLQEFQKWKYCSSTHNKWRIDVCMKNTSAINEKARCEMKEHELR